ncbi:hypothetical protein JHK86_027409 [Glycine max]|nr:hypothetical protein JHK86_027409 [Glycine max]
MRSFCSRCLTFCVKNSLKQKGRKLHTTHSWEFMDLEGNDGVIPSDSLFRKARYGEDTIIANFDTGNFGPLFLLLYIFAFPESHLP